MKIFKTLIYFARGFLLITSCPPHLRSAVLTALSAQARLQHDDKVAQDVADMLETVANKLRPSDVGAIAVLIECAEDPLHQAAAICGRSRTGLS